MSLYCDLSVNGITVFSGTACLNGVGLQPFSYMGFSGNLYFLDAQGFNDPTYDGLGTRYLLFYIGNGLNNTFVPLQAIPAQTFDVVLGNQNCTISIYEKDVS